MAGARRGEAAARRDETDARGERRATRLVEGARRKGYRMERRVAGDEERRRRGETRGGQQARKAAKCTCESVH